jgi:chromosome segregation ATPase
VQYLAELKKTQSMLGSSVEIRLLARNSIDQKNSTDPKSGNESSNAWQSVTNEDNIKIDQNLAKEIKDGQLVIAELSNSKSVTGLQEASRRLVLILQNFSRLEQKYKQGEEDIEQWKQSLNYQTQELHRREVELQEKEEQLEDLESKRLEMEGLQERLHKQREELEQWRQEYDSEQGSLANQAAALNLDEAHYLRDLTQRISGTVVDLGALQHQINTLYEVLNQRQDSLNVFWQQLQSQQQQVQGEQSELEHLSEIWQQHKQQWLHAQAAMSEAETGLRLRQESLKLKHSQTDRLKQQLQEQESLIQQTSHLVHGLGGVVEVLKPEEVLRLEEMPLPELESALQEWEHDYERIANYVNAQEDEVAAIEGEIADLQSQISRANDFERIELDNDKEFAEEQYKMLNTTLEGQRKNLRDRQVALEHQRSIYERRQGIASTNSLSHNIMPILTQLQAHKTVLQQELQQLEREIVAISDDLTPQQEMLSQQESQLQIQQQDLDSLDAQLQEKIRTVSYLWGGLAQQEQLLRPAQDVIDALRNQLDATANQLNQTSSDQDQSALISELQQRIEGLMPVA